MYWPSRYAYSRWDGTQRVFDIDEEAIMDEMADDLIAHGDERRALRELLQRGLLGADGQRMPGLRDLMERLHNRRQQRLQQFDMDSVVNELKERLDRVLQTEREGIDRRLQEAREQAAESGDGDREEIQRLMELLQRRADRNREKLDELPPDLGGAIRGLQDYDFMDPEAQAQFKELMDMLRRQMMGNVAQDLKQQMQQMGPQEMAALREMLRDLNRMMREKM